MIVKKRIILWTVSCATTIINNDVKFSSSSIIMRETRLKTVTLRNESKEKEDKLFSSFSKLSCESNEDRYWSIILQLLTKKSKSKKCQQMNKKQVQKKYFKS